VDEGMGEVAKDAIFYFKMATEFRAVPDVPREPNDPKSSGQLSCLVERHDGRNQEA
jgi:hypothetical protein